MAKESNRRGGRVGRRREKNDINIIKREIVVGSLAVRLFYLLLLSFCLVLLTGRHVLAVQTHCSVEDEGSRPVLRMATQGGLSETEGFQNSTEIDELARFAVDEHNEKENALLELSRVVNAKEQVVAGKLHHLTLEVVEAGKKMIYEAKVWVKPWMNFKELQEFKNAGESPATFTACDLGAKRGGHEPGWRDVPTHDPVVQDAANHAVKAIQERSNSLLPYELLDILHSKAEVIEEIARFDLLLKLKRGNKEEKFKVEVHKNLEGNFLLNQMQLHHSD